MTDNPYTGAMLREIRERARLTQDELGELLGLTRRTIGALEARGAEPIKPLYVLAATRAAANEAVRAWLHSTEQAVVSVDDPPDGT